MSVEIFLSPSLQTLVNDQAVVDISGNTLGECLNNLMQKYPQLKAALVDDNLELRRDYMIYVNGENAYPEESSRPIKDGDKLNLMSFFVGG
jgi:molybdopterin converting factor small subunit